MYKNEKKATMLRCLIHDFINISIESLKCILQIHTRAHIFHEVHNFDKYNFNTISTNVISKQSYVCVCVCVCR